MTALTRVVKQHNGVLDKFVGDLLMAIFGAPVSYGNDALDAARCALELLRERERLNQTSRYKLQVGIGVATGSVVAGCMGSADRLNYTVLGERVNLASRLCDRAGPSEVWIDQTTRERLEGHIAVESPTVVHLKGFAQAIDAYELIEVRAEKVTA
jgi:class 3 adenylate cyclase